MGVCGLLVVSFYDLDWFDEFLWILLGFAIVYCLVVIACFGGISDLYAVDSWFGHLGWLFGLLLCFGFCICC